MDNPRVLRWLAIVVKCTVFWLVDTAQKLGQPAICSLKLLWQFLYLEIRLHFFPHRVLYKKLQGKCPTYNSSHKLAES